MSPTQIGRWLVVFCDEINLPAPDRYGTQRAISFLRQLVEQNSSLKKEVAIAERKLIARNERIQSLESLLQDSQEKLTAANHRYVLSVNLNAAHADVL